jgi:hypothetical protein
MKQLFYYNLILKFYKPLNILLDLRFSLAYTKV